MCNPCVMSCVIFVILTAETSYFQGFSRFYMCNFGVLQKGRFKGAMNEAKQYLKRIEYLDKLIQIKVDQVGTLKQRAVSTEVKLSTDRVQTSISGDKFGNCICSAVDTEAEIDKMIDELCDLKDDCRRKIDSIEDKDEQIVLNYRYFQYLNMTEISDIIGKSVRQTQRIHGSALSSFGLLMGSSIKNDTKMVI